MRRLIISLLLATTTTTLVACNSKSESNNTKLGVTRTLDKSYEELTTEDLKSYPAFEDYTAEVSIKNRFMPEDNFDKDDTEVYEYLDKTTKYIKHYIESNGLLEVSDLLNVRKSTLGTEETYNYSISWFGGTNTADNGIQTLIFGSDLDSESKPTNIYLQVTMLIPKEEYYKKPFNLEESQLGKIITEVVGAADTRVSDSYKISYGIKESIEKENFSSYDFYGGVSPERFKVARNTSTNDDTMLSVSYEIQVYAKN